MWLPPVKAVIVSAPPGLGKSIFAEALAIRLGCSATLDSWTPFEPLTPGALHLTNAEVFTLAQQPATSTAASIPGERVGAAGADPLATQVGGSHYKDMAIQPVEYIHRNGIGFCEGCAIKYLSRWRAKGGLQDLRKARHFIDLLIELEERTGTSAAKGAQP